MSASLYGIHNSNRNFADPYYWGKNQFNSAFPVALCCYMRDQKIPANYLKLEKTLDLAQVPASFDEIFNTSEPNEKLSFSFESRYPPFSTMVHDDLKSIDLVIKLHGSETYFRPLEVKLTTLPDSVTCELDESEYGSELVVRNPTTRYMALNMAASCSKDLPIIRDILEPSCHNVRDWNNLSEMSSKKTQIFEALENIFSEFHHRQQPLLLQPIWKTVGKSAELAHHCLDVFVWSDFALSRLFMGGGGKIPDKINRQERTALRLARCLYEIGKSGRVYQQSIYDGMTFDNLNDKEFAVSGARTNQMMRCERLTSPIITKDKIQKIILGGGQKHLSPERRFDAIIYFSKELFDDEETR
ncbi:MAG: HindVP family restriction endonuclease [Verrucomicrobia bacterium]|nr:HindVP family restriction endonuclease [Verrucomicrobiota bacterium]MCH8510572.1 HindVP family restriction endonuclease [Kiritimatiellia bacterium]